MSTSSGIMGRRWLWTALATGVCTVAVIATSTSRGDLLDILEARRAEEKALLVQQNQVDSQLDAILYQNNEPGVPTTQRDQMLRKSQTLNLMREEISKRLKDVESEIRNTTFKQTQDLFAGTFDVYLDALELASGKPSVRGATLDRRLYFNGHLYVRLFTASGWSVIDPEKIIAIRSCPATRPADGTF